MGWVSIRASGSLSLVSDSISITQLCESFAFRKTVLSVRGLVRGVMIDRQRDSELRSGLHFDHADSKYGNRAAPITPALLPSLAIWTGARKAAFLRFMRSV